MKVKELFKELEKYEDYDISYEYIGRESGCRCGYCYDTHESGLEKDRIKIDKKYKQIILQTSS